MALFQSNFVAFGAAVEEDCTFFQIKHSALRCKFATPQTLMAPMNQPCGDLTVYRVICVIKVLRGGSKIETMPLGFQFAGLTLGLGQTDTLGTAGSHRRRWTVPLATPRDALLATLVRVGIVWSRPCDRVWATDLSVDEDCFTACGQEVPLEQLRLSEGSAALP